ncbi:hypothetical protein [Oceaniglobus indicus]|uniref:hypothetical protein n=1 Tax=Oceaniglobus indicus TaxID=2047749 RepID=UPI0011AB80A0|nr:hypothetical protein [Oceaniglobus indicus]
MRHPVIATLLAAALAMGPIGATGARAANNDQLGRLLAGAAAVAIIGLAYKADQKHDRKQAAQAQTHAPAPDRYEPPRGKHFGLRDKRHTKNRDGHQVFFGPKQVPRACLRHVQTRWDTRDFLSSSCLERSMRGDVNRLPRQCSAVYHGRRGPVAGYDPHCLGRFGWHQV